jgi:hypothetical protein
MMNITAIKRPTNIVLLVERVPSEAVMIFLFERLPARKTAAIIGTNHTIIMITPPTALVNVVFALKPAKALPLLFAIDENAYSISEKPCAPSHP